MNQEKKRKNLKIRTKKLRKAQRVKYLKHKNKNELKNKITKKNQEITRRCRLGEN